MPKPKFNFQTQAHSNEEASAPEEVISTGPVQTILHKLEHPAPRTVLDNYKILPRHKLRSNNKNSYKKHSLETLKESILRYDIQQDITAVYLMREDMYVIEAGHRRKECLDDLINEFKDYSGDLQNERYQLYLKNIQKYELGYPCKMTGRIDEDTVYDFDENTDLSSIPSEVIDSEIRLHITNIEARNDDSADRAANISRLAKLYAAKNKSLPREDRINVNEKIAENLNLSVRQVIHYKNIEHLIPELQEAFSNHNITLKEGSSYSKLTTEDQYKLLSLLQSGNKLNSETYHLLESEKSNLTDTIEKQKQELQELKDRLSRSAPGSLPDGASKSAPGSLLAKEQKIQELEKKIQQLKNKESSLNNPDSESITLLKKELELKTAFDHAHKSIEKVLFLFQEYSSLPHNSSGAASQIMSIESCTQEFKHLLLLLNQFNQSHEED